MMLDYANHSGMARGMTALRCTQKLLSAMIKRIQPQAAIAMPLCTPLNAPIATAAPSCPSCGNTMVRRTARKGFNAGNAFWGCSNYPQCREIVAID